MADTAIVLQKQRDIQSQEEWTRLTREFLASMDVALSSKATYERQLRQFLSWMDETARLEKLASREFEQQDILAYKQSLLDQGLSVYTINSYLSVVRKLFEWLEAMKIYPNIARVKGLQKPRGYRKEPLSKEQLREILDSLDRSGLDGLRDYAMINLMARTGLRDVEVSRAMVSDIRQKSGKPVLWVQGKGRDAKDDFVLLTPEAEKPVRAYLKARGKLQENAPVFCSHSDRNKGQALTTRSISRIVKESFRDVGLDSKQLTAHSLRHTAITLSILGGASLHQAQAMARHSSSDTTLIYFHNLDRVEAGAEQFIAF